MDNNGSAPEAAEKSCCKKPCCNKGGTQAAGGVYGLSFVGAVVYYLQHSPTFWAGVLGILKALVWPAILVYHLLAFLKQ